MRPIQLGTPQGDHHAINPLEIERVYGRGQTFTIHLRSGNRTEVVGANITVGEFIKLWLDALDSPE